MLNGQSSKKVVALFGASGLLGTYFANHLRFCGYEVVGVGRRRATHVDANFEFDILKDEIRKISELDFDIAINSAALASHALCEESPEIAIRVNQAFPLLLGQLCSDRNVPLVHISTDAVFGGSHGAPYREQDSKLPLDIYAVTKSRAEDLLIDHEVPAWIVRTNFFGVPTSHQSSIFWDFLTKLRQDDDVVAFCDYEVSSIYAGHLADLIAQLVDIPPAGLIHIGSSDGKSKYDFAHLVAEVFELPNEKIRSESIKGPFGLPNRGENLTLDSSLAETLLGVSLPSQRAGVLAAKSEVFSK